MTQYDESVEQQRLLLEAEEWAKGVACIHVHSMSSMYYDTRPQDTADGQSVTDVEYNNGIVERKQRGKLIHTFGEKLKGKDLLDAYLRK